MNDRWFLVFATNTQTLLDGHEETTSCDVVMGDLHLRKLVKVTVHHGEISSILPIEIFGHIHSILMSPGAEVLSFTEGRQWIVTERAVASVTLEPRQDKFLIILEIT